MTSFENFASERTLIDSFVANGEIEEATRVLRARRISFGRFLAISSRVFFREDREIGKIARRRLCGEVAPDSAQVAIQHSPFIPCARRFLFSRRRAAGSFSLERSPRLPPLSERPSMRRFSCRSADGVLVRIVRCESRPFSRLPFP